MKTNERHRGVFSTFRFSSRVLNFQLLKLLSTLIYAHSAGIQILPSPPSRHPPPLLWPTSPLPTQRSSSTYPAGGQTLPSQPNQPTSSLPTQRSSSNPAVPSQPCRPTFPPPPQPAVMAVKLSCLRPAVILHPCWRPTSPLPS